MSNSDNSNTDTELDLDDPVIKELNRIGRLVPREVERQAREYEEQMEIAERAFGKAVRELNKTLAEERSRI